MPMIGTDATLPGNPITFAAAPLPRREGEDHLEVVINASLRTVDQTLVNVDNRPDWLEGVETIDREMTSERINMRHNRVFHGMKVVNTAVYSNFAADRAQYSEKVEVPAVNVTLHAHYEMESLGANSTLLKFNVNWLDSKLPAENKQGNGTRTLLSLEGRAPTPSHPDRRQRSSAAGPRRPTPPLRPDLISG